MRADGRCDGCGSMIATGHEVELIFHTACVPLPMVPGFTGTLQAAGGGAALTFEAGVCVEVEDADPLNPPPDPYLSGLDAGFEQKTTHATKALRVEDDLRELLS